MRRARTVIRGRLFYRLNLERRVPSNHMVRANDRAGPRRVAMGLTSSFAVDRRLFR
jgi:hypothetical protein